MAKALKVGLIGCGSISRNHLNAYKQFPEKVQLTAVCDIREDAVRQFAKEAKVDKVYLDYTKLIKEADIDAVDIVAGNDVHAAMTVAAAEAGKHVLVEKTMAVTLDECRKMIEVTDKAGVTLMVAQDLRYQPSSQAVKRMLEEGKIGRVWAARCEDWFNIVPPKGSDVPLSSLWISHSPWMLEKNKAGGGIIYTIVCHHLDLLRYYIGNATVAKAYATFDHPMLKGGIEYICGAAMEFQGPFGEIPVYAMGSYVSAPPPVRNQYMLFGEEGTIFSQPLENGTALEQLTAQAMISSWDKTGYPADPLSPNRKELFSPVPPADLPSNDAFVNEILHFADCCQSGKEPISSGKDNLNTMRLLVGICKSAAVNEPVDVRTL
jgi:predicted dehydrogenase